MDANVRAAAAETLRLCREAGHDVSPAVAALYVQAQRLAKVHPNDLVAHCVAKLAAAGDPALETLKMQMDVEATRALRAHAAAETRRARETRARPVSRPASTPDFRAHLEPPTLSSPVSYTHLTLPTTPYV